MNQQNQFKQFVRGLVERLRQERAAGKSDLADGLAIMLLGALSLAVPYVGVPLITWGLWKSAKV